MEVVLEGTLSEDGSLQLDEKPSLPPGRVRVVVQTAPSGREPESILDTIRRIWKDQRERGHIPRSKEEVDSELREMRDEWEEHQLAIERLQEECRRSRE